MSVSSELLSLGRPVASQRPWPRLTVDREGWQRAAELASSGSVAVLGFWCDGAAVHLCLGDKPLTEPVVLTLAVEDGSFPWLAQKLPSVGRLERTITDLFGFKAQGAQNPRPWLDHGRWGRRHPLARHGSGESETSNPVRYEFRPADGPSLHQIPVGPVHAGIIEPGHFRFTASGETVVRLEERLGYVHKGIDGLLARAPLGNALRVAARVSGDSTVAYSIAFARAIEAALEAEVPPAAHDLRAIMAELERIANHLGDIGAICNDASFSLMHAHCGALRERTLRASKAAFGHRLMMDCVIPGGVASDLAPGGREAIGGLIQEIRKDFPRLTKLYESTTSLQDRTVTTGTLRRHLAEQFGAGGFVGRASGRDCDARSWPAYAPYDHLSFVAASRVEGDVDARVWVRIEEVNQSLSLLDQLLARTTGPDTKTVRAGLTWRSGREGLAFVESFRGDILAWVRTGPGETIACAHLRDPSWFQWPLLEAAIEGNIVADFPLCNKSFNCSYSGHDL